mmetsp:Transcript_46751/g.95617  ORF Transcript_46751/g.95617 Transcript_46751/m.95617 type:complete len:441 (-) Transcript_46751:318-1640(-)|eukprot:CAMPEP_0181307314 /NCGR_PEP_ID=MMETSP1101-20121128/10805_1 /TAXON_ID=46948 /ORGANISM="Rhodomonas abbreviata, Strain Caron Lab Isolate" /LENGTH=440 /DNA_ID=CAMNT_0023413505 /DNA_START=376 /DNA_END=1698 /DNA_ORIENTATION=+
MGGSGEEEAHVGLGELGERLVAPPDGALEDQALLLLQPQDAVLDRVLDHEADNADGLELPQPVDPIHRLKLNSRVPPRVHDVHRTGNGEVERDAAGLERDEKHAGVEVLGEGGDVLVALFEGHASVELEALDTREGESVFDEVEHRDELREYDAFCRWVFCHQHLELLDKRLNLGAAPEILNRRQPLYDPRNFLRPPRHHTALATPGPLTLQVHRQRLRAAGARDRLGGRGGEVVLEACTAKGMRACRAHAVFKRLAAQAAQGVVVVVVAGANNLLRFREVFLRVLHEVGVVDGLPEADEQVEDVCVVVEHCAGSYVGVELRLALRVEALVVVRLEGVEGVLAEHDSLGRQHDVLGSPLLGSPQQNPIQHLMLEPQHGTPPSAGIPKPLDGVHDVLVPPAVVVDPVLPAVLTVLPRAPKVPVQRLALSLLLEVVRVRVDA